MSDQLLRTCTKSVPSKPYPSFIEKNTGGCEESCIDNESRIPLPDDSDAAFSFFTTDY